jgi:alpha-D-ribose 1-methylphosphonate 5-triphosphate synthase subunit PhnH
VILICDRISQGNGFAISGPGIKGEAAFSFAPVPAGFVSFWHRNRDAFPLGIDLVVTAGDQLVCLPRSSRIIREAA